MKLFTIVMSSLILTLMPAKGSIQEITVLLADGKDANIVVIDEKIFEDDYVNVIQVENGDGTVNDVLVNRTQIKETIDEQVLQVTTEKGTDEFTAYNVEVTKHPTNAAFKYQFTLICTGDLGCPQSLSGYRNGESISTFRQSFSLFHKKATYSGWIYR